MEGWVEEPEGELGACVGMHCSTVYISGDESRTLGVSVGGSGHVGTGAEGQQVQDPDHTLVGVDCCRTLCSLGGSLCPCA